MFHEKLRCRFNEDLILKKKTTKFISLADVGSFSAVHVLELIKNPTINCCVFWIISILINNKAKKYMVMYM